MINGQPEIVLASASPRRAQLLTAMGVGFRVVESAIDETQLKGEEPVEMVKRLALEKGRHVAANNKNCVVLSADTVVVYNNEVFGKPKDTEDARRMLGLLQGKWHEVMGGVAIIDLIKETEHIEVFVTRVKMIPLSDQEIAQYVQTGEPMGKAGSYAIQGIAGNFIESVEGSYSNVIGLNTASVFDYLRKNS